jgi:Domain of unknown function (DUF4249)
MRAMKRSLIILLQGGLFYALASCLGPISVDTEPDFGKIVITGQVSTVTHRNFVQVSQTQGTKSQSSPVSGLNVSVEDDLGQIYWFPESEAGTYRGSNFTGIPGRSYHVIVETPEGARYESAPEKLPVVIGTDEVTYDFSEEDYLDASGTPQKRQFLNLSTQVKIPSPEAPYYLKWTVDEIYLLVPTDFPDPFGSIPPPCYISKTTDPQRVVLYDGSKKTPLDGDFFVASRIADFKSFHTKYSYYVYRSSITAEAYEYWRKVKALVSQVGTIFDTPPAEIKGNITRIDRPSTTVYGYFQASNETYNAETLYAFDMPFLPTVYCEYDARKSSLEYPAECLDCLKAASSSLEEPELFKGDK